MLTCMSNIDPTKSEWQKNILQAYLDGKDYCDIDDEGTSDEEVARLVRTGFTIKYNDMFGLYKARWSNPK